MGELGRTSPGRAPTRSVDAPRSVGDWADQGASQSVNCDEVVEQLADYLDDEARKDLCRAIEEHLGRCRDCHLYVDTLRKTIVLYQADRAVDMPPAVQSKLEAALARAYSEASVD